MAGASKKRAQRERERNREESSNGNGSNGDSSNHKSTPSPPSGVSEKMESPSSPPTRFDGNRDPAVRSSSDAQQGRKPATLVAGGIENRNLDLGGMTAAMMSRDGNVALELPKRLANPNNTGIATRVKLNTFNVTAWPQRPVYQFDVLIGNNAEKVGLCKKIMSLPTVKKALGPSWIFDGKKIGYALSLPQGRDEWKETIDMDVEQGREPRKDKDGTLKQDKKRVVVKMTKKIDFASLQAFLDNQADFTVACLEAINFLDHLIREKPSMMHIAIRQNFFFRSTQPYDLGQGLQALKGIYASLRIGCKDFSRIASLTVHLDVTNSAFWAESNLLRIVQDALNQREPVRLQTILAAGTQNSKVRSGMLTPFKRLMVYTQHLTHMSKEEQKARPFKIRTFLDKTSKQFQIRGVQMTTGGPAENLSIFDYFRRKYSTTLRYPDLPVVELDKQINGAYIAVPMELLYLKEAQRYIGKLSDTQTTKMLNFAVQRPAQRWQSLEDGKKALKWPEDEYLRNYGLQISSTPTAVQGRVLPAPDVGFAGGAKETPGTTGSWRLDRKRFYRNPPAKLEVWGVCSLDRRLPDTKIKEFMRQWKQTMIGHGIPIGPDPYVHNSTERDLGKLILEAFTQTGNQWGRKPQFMIWIVPNKDKQTYERIKKSLECRPNMGIVSQVIQSTHVDRGYKPQYGSNVAMKVNAKLGGVTAKAISKSKTTIPPGSMFIGGDVTHGVRGDIPGQSQASICSISMSADQEYVKYFAACETNGVRREMITRANIQKLVGTLTKEWVKGTNGKLPSHVYYIRDGVSEGMFPKVLGEELAYIRETFRGMSEEMARKIRYICIIGTKRHHVRFFPGEQGYQQDKDGNPLPGTLVETGITHPREYEFYLCSHKAIKGTARPVKYNVIHNDVPEFSASKIQNMLYEASYSFVRSSTPVSLFPATYYAHLAAARGRCHEDAKALSSGAAEGTQTGSDSTSDIPTYPLMPFGANGGNVAATMWYV